MRKLMKYAAAVAVTALMSGPAFATIEFTDDFESYNLPDGNPIGGGWTWFLNGWDDGDGFPAFPVCTNYVFGYGPNPAPNSNGPYAVSNIAVGATGQALNVFSDYGNQDWQQGGGCLETSVFQELVFDSANAGDYTFSFDTQVPEALGDGVTVFAFVKLLDPNNGYGDVFGGLAKVDTSTAGSKSIDVTLTADQNGMILQWGFTNIASYNLPSSRWYDNVSFAPQAVEPPPVGPDPTDIEGIPIPKWALLLIAAMLAYLGATRLRSHRQ
jgi:hypothetical protein